MIRLITMDFLRQLARLAGRKPHRPDRPWVLEYAKPNGIGAELGVFKGVFSPVLASRLRPKKLYLVDPWWKLHGERYPARGRKKDHGELETKTAYDLTVRSVSRYQDSCNIEIVVERSQEFLQSYDGAAFDWVYLDSSHSYDQTCEELSLIAAKLAPNGVILGDDWNPDPRHRHHGVFKAIHEFLRKGDFEIVAAGPGRQWAIRLRRSE